MSSYSDWGISLTWILLCFDTDARIMRFSTTAVFCYSKDNFWEKDRKLDNLGIKKKAGFCLNLNLCYLILVLIYHWSRRCLLFVILIVPWRFCVNLVLGNDILVEVAYSIILLFSLSNLAVPLCVVTDFLWQMYALDQCFFSTLALGFGFNFIMESFKAVNNLALSYLSRSCLQSFGYFTCCFLRIHFDGQIVTIFFLFLFIYKTRPCWK